MSYQLDFPMTQLPHDAHVPPYVQFGIQGVDVSPRLPPKIPLKVVLHYAPKLSQWLLPPEAMTRLSCPATQVSLRIPYVSIDIRSPDVDARGLRWILSRMLQVSGLTNPASLFLIHPTILTSVSIHRTWLALDLAPGGIANLQAHIQARLMAGPAVTLAEMEILWDTFPKTSDIVRAMAHNYVRSQINFDYSQAEIRAIEKWYSAINLRRFFFRSVERQYPEFAEVQMTVQTTTSREFAMAARRKAVMGTESNSEAEVLKVVNGQQTLIRRRSVMERTTTTKVTLQDLKERETRDFQALRKRLRRIRSDTSIRSVETVIWSPLDEEDAAAATGDVSSKKSTAADTTGASPQLTRKNSVEKPWPSLRRSIRKVRSQENLDSNTRQRKAQPQKPVSSSERDGTAV